MSRMELIKISIFGTGIAFAGSLMAEELMSVSAQEQVRWEQKSLVSQDQEQDSFREQVHQRMRYLSQEEKQLMSDTGYNGRARMFDEASGNGRGNARPVGGLDESQGYGRGFESRHSQLGASPMNGGISGGMTGAGQSGSGPGRPGRGR